VITRSHGGAGRSPENARKPGVRRSPGGARRSQGGAKRSQEEPGGAPEQPGRSQEEPRRSQEDPGGPGAAKEEPGKQEAPRRSQEEPGGARRTNGGPGGAEVGPERARNTSLALASKKCNSMGVANLYGSLGHLVLMLETDDGLEDQNFIFFQKDQTTSCRLNANGINYLWECCVVLVLSLFGGSIWWRLLTFQGNE
jgi:hypothetical protein